MSSTYDKAELLARAQAALEAITPEENAAITAAALLDPDNPPLLDDRVGLPAVIAIEADIADRLKAEGPEWRLRANQLLREALGL